jgi:hypothetical protein
VAAEEWDVYVVDEVREWIDQLDEATHARVVQAIDVLAEGGPASGDRSLTRSSARRSRT